MKLTPRELKILACAELAAQQSAQQLARRTKLQTHSVNYGVRKLQALGVLGQPRLAINPAALGYTDMCLFFSIGALKSATKQSLIEELRTCQDISWLAEIGGPYQYALSFLTKRPVALQEYLELLLRRFGQVFAHKSLNIRTQVNSYGRKYLSRLAALNDPIVLGGEPTSHECDQTDARILSGLANQDYHSLRELSAKLQIAFSTLQRRIEVLKEARVITGAYFPVNPIALGVQVFNLLIFITRSDLELKQKLASFCRSHDRIVHFVQCMGSWDYEVVVEGNSSTIASEVAAEISDQFGSSIHMIQPLPVMRYLKFSAYPWTR